MINNNKSNQLLRESRKFEFLNYEKKQKYLKNKS